MQKAEAKWRLLLDLALTERTPSRLNDAIVIAETAMLARVQTLLNAPEEGTEYESLMNAMRLLYEHRLRHDLDPRAGSF